MMNCFEQTLIKRRTIYNLSPETTISNSKIEDIVKECVKNCPSAFNSQSSRAVILFGDSHKKLWDIVIKTLEMVVEEENLSQSKERINLFKNAYASILFFDQTDITEKFALEKPLYRDLFANWAQQSSGMLQFAIWCILESYGMGVNIQHYNPLIDVEVKEVFKIPQSWKLICQMVMGKPTASADIKEFSPLEERVLTF